ncbi:MAG TPA: energy transducer TonB [Polyangia bacterium]
MGWSEHAPATKTPRAREKRVGRFLILALLIHAEVLLLLGLGAYLLAPRDADVQARLAASREPESIDIGMVDYDAARQIVADLERQEEARKAEEVKKEIDSIKAPGQVVDVPAPREEKRPDQARFASEHDTTVDREMRKYGKFDPEARQGDASGEAEAPRPPSPAAAPTPARPAPPRLALREPRPVTGRPDDAPPGQKAAPAPGADNGAVDPEAPDPEGLVPRYGKLQMRSGAEGAPGSQLSLMPTAAQMARAIGSGTQDALKDIDEGDETALNSKKWKWASFFNRVKHQVQEHWHPDEVYRRRDPNRSIYGRTSRLTIVRVQLKPNGHLANVELETPSGLEFLDDEALQAFRAAQPFPNPPRQLVDRSDGLINFQFGFLFELSGVSRPMLFKYNM